MWVTVPYITVPQGRAVLISPAHGKPQLPCCLDEGRHKVQVGQRVLLEVPVKVVVPYKHVFPSADSVSKIFEGLMSFHYDDTLLKLTHRALEEGTPTPQQVLAMAAYEASAAAAAGLLAQEWDTHQRKVLAEAIKSLVVKRTPKMAVEVADPVVMQDIALAARPATAEAQI